MQNMTTPDNKSPPIEFLDSLCAEVEKLKGEIERSKWMPFESEYEQVIKHADKLAEKCEFVNINTSVCEEHKQGNNPPFCTNECQFKRETGKSSPITGSFARGRGNERSRLPRLQSLFR